MIFENLNLVVISPDLLKCIRFDYILVFVSFFFCNFENFNAINFDIRFCLNVVEYNI